MLQVTTVAKRVIETMLNQKIYTSTKIPKPDSPVLLRYLSHSVKRSVQNVSREHFSRCAA